MVTTSKFRKMAMAIPNTIESPHFEKTSFRVMNKFLATLSEADSRACVKLSIADQSVFCLIDKEMIYPVPNKWGLQGWTNINLVKITVPLLRDLLNSAHAEVIKAKPSKKSQ